MPPVREIGVGVGDGAGSRHQCPRDDTNRNAGSWTETGRDGVRYYERCGVLLVFPLAVL